jgi:hypothetical protein
MASMGTPESTRAPTWVLLEGTSDVAAVRAAADRLGVPVDEQEVVLVDMGGATNVRHHLAEAASQEVSPRVLGMCDVKEGSFFVRALRDLHIDVGSVAELPRWGFQVCVHDLEDELMRALGPTQVRDVLRGLGLTARFAAFTQQPAWSARGFHEQAHRFAGVASGRKELMAAALAAALDPDALPAPLQGLLDDIAGAGPSLAGLRSDDRTGT